MIYTIRSNSKNIDWRANGNERIVQNVLNILRTKHYEIPFNRDMGINPDYIDSSLYNNKVEIIEDVKRNISIYESRANILSINVESCDSEGNLLITVEIEV